MSGSVSRLVKLAPPASKAKQPSLLAQLLRRALTGQAIAAFPKLCDLTIPAIRFYNKTDEATYYMSNFSNHRVYFWGREYKTAEVLFQSLKFISHKPKHANKIHGFSTPREAYNYVRSDVKQQHVYWGWQDDSHNITAMALTLYFKFIQNEGIKQKLLKTDRKELVEDTPDDGYWGRGANHRGYNVLGFLLMLLRRWLRENPNPDSMKSWHDGHSGWEVNKDSWTKAANDVKFIREVIEPYRTKLRHKEYRKLEYKYTKRSN